MLGLYGQEKKESIQSPDGSRASALVHGRRERATTAREEFEVACSSGSRLEMCSDAAAAVRAREFFFFSLFYADGGR